jgi:hypothetical protein
LQRQLAAFVTKLLEPLEAVMGTAERFAGLADVAKLLGKFEQTNLGLYDLLVLGH